MGKYKYFYLEFLKVFTSFMYGSVAMETDT
jgi:hypothetical protein